MHFLLVNSFIKTQNRFNLLWKVGVVVMVGFFIVILVMLFSIALILLIVKKKFEVFDIYAIILFLLQMIGVFNEFADYYIDEIGRAHV